MHIYYFYLLIAYCNREQNNFVETRVPFSNMTYYSTVRKHDSKLFTVRDNWKSATAVQMENSCRIDACYRLFYSSYCCKVIPLLPLLYTSIPNAPSAHLSLSHSSN